jgi:hypothetical protein
MILLLQGSAGSQVEGDSLSVSKEISSVDSTGSLSLGMLMLRADSRYRTGLILSYPSRPGIDTHAMLGGYRLHRATMYEMALEGAGAGMTMGAMIGALGMMTDAWDEKEAWYAAGAAAAIGAILGVSKSDDPEWNIRVRWDPDR